MADIDRSPSVPALFEAKATMTFSIDSAGIKFEPPCECSFHFRYCVIALNIRGASVNTMRDEDVSIHANM